MAIKVQRDSVLGIVFFGGLLLLLWGTFQLADFSFGPKPSIDVAFPDARGVKRGDNVFVLGTKFGVVESVDYLPNRKLPIHMKLTLAGDLTFKADYAIEIADASLLGGKQISISPGKSTDSNEKPLIGKAPPHPLKALGDLFSGEDDKKSLGKMLQNFGDLAEDLLTGKGTIGGAIGSARTAFERVGAAAEEVRIAVADARKGTGNLGWVVKKAGDFLASADDVAKAVRSGEGLASRLLSNRTLADNVEKSMQNLRTVTDELAAGRGPLGRLLRDPAMEKEIQLIVRNLNEAMTALNEGKGLAQALLHDQSLRDNARSIVSDLRGVANDLELGKGTIGRLIKDETVYLQIERLLNQVSRVIEDQREAAPVSTFFNIFTGAFQ